jgi:hypothetical protein
MILNNLPHINNIKTVSKCWSPTGFIGIEINGVMYKEPEATQVIKHYSHIQALEIVNKYNK